MPEPPLRIAGYQGERSVHTRAMRAMIGALEADDTRIRVDFEPDIASRGRKVSELLGLVEGGEIDLCYFSSSYLSARVPALGALDVPFRFTDRADTQARLAGALGDLLRGEIGARTGYRALGFWDNGLRHLSNALRPVRGPDDCKGLRIRTLPNRIYHDTFRALGMEPVTIDVGDMVRAIAAGEVDAQENPLTNVQLFGLERYHPHVTTTAHFHGIALVLCNTRAHDRWPQDMRAALEAALERATVAQWRFSAEDDERCRAALPGMGVSIRDPDAAARAAFRSAAGPVARQALDTLPADAAALLP